MLAHGPVDLRRTMENERGELGGAFAAFCDVEENGAPTNFGHITYPDDFTDSRYVAWSAVAA